MSETLIDTTAGPKRGLPRWLRGNDAIIVDRIVSLRNARKLRVSEARDV